MAELRLRVLGDLEVIRGEAVLALPPSRKTRALLAYLALSERSLRREQLCELLWEIPDDPRGSLRWSLSKIRKLVDDPERPRIIADRSSVGFDTSDMDIDLCGLRDLVRDGLDEAPTDALEQAAMAWQGSFLEGLDLPDFNDFYTWCIGHREQASRAQATLLRTLLDRLDNEPDRALTHASRLVSLLPDEESARAHLIGLLLRLKRKPEAEQQYRLGLQKLEEVGGQDRDLLHRAWRSGAAPVSGGGDVIPAANRSPPPTGAGTDHSLLGRDREIALLGQLIEELPTATRAAVVLIRGHPGMGKSSLLQHAARLARGVGAGILKASAFESEQIRPFAVWNDALRRALPDNPTSKLLSSGERITRDQAFASLNDLLKEETDQRPVVILFDDVQWCDESSVSALHHVLRVSPRQPFLLVAAARETEMRENAAVQQAVRSLRHDNLLRELRLEPLTPGELAVLIERHSPGVDVARLSEQCGGNPLMAIELARAEAEGGSADSLTELVQDRMSRLDAAGLEVLLWSAVLSPRIDLKSLALVTGLEPAVIDCAIEAAEQQGILHPGPRGFRFSHSLIARSIYQEITPARKQVMHRRVAEMLEEASGRDLELAADLAHHAPLSGDSALAARAMVSAGKLCLRFYANEDALQLYERGVQFVSGLPESERVCLAIELCDVRLNAAPLEDWEAAVGHYTALAEQALDYGELSHARLGYQMASYVRWMNGQWSGARRDSLQAERVTRAGEDEAHIVGMAETAKCLLLLERDLSQADAMVMEAHSRAQRVDIQFPALPSALGLLRYYEGRLDDAVELLEEARAIGRAQGDRSSECLAIEYLAAVEVEREDYGAAMERCRCLLEISSRLREGSEYPFARALEALCEYSQAGAESGLDERLQAVRDADAKQRLAFLLNRAAALDIRHGQLDRALQRSTEALELAQLMERPTEILLARINLEKINRLGTAETDSSNRDSIVAISEGTVAGWARERAVALLAEEK